MYTNLDKIPATKSWGIRDFSIIVNNQYSTEPYSDAFIFDFFGN